MNVLVFHCKDVGEVSFQIASTGLQALMLDTFVA